MSAPSFPGIGGGQRTRVARAWDDALAVGVRSGAIPSHSIGGASTPPPPRTASAQALDDAYRTGVPQSWDQIGASIGLRRAGREPCRLYAPAPPRCGGA